ncbi:UNVERIFIED_CONTAM: hypothetical protein Slati_1517800 [Sesamum latifolium]|uniref:Uncharacterized protein n=1 Tax=Sesamum latifolium TaxID=2727402 RepID=A0AAW2X672_9LAMI
MPRSSTGGRFEANDSPRKGVIRMIVGGPAGGDSQRARKAQVQGAYGLAINEVMDVGAGRHPLILFRQTEQSEHKVSCNDALAITAPVGQLRSWAYLHRLR